MDTEQTIELLHTLFITFLVLTIVFTVISVLLFFLLRIKEVFNSITGRAVRKTVQEMEEANNATGRLRKVNRMAMGEMTPASLNDPPVKVTEKLDQPVQQSTQDNIGNENTSLLNDGTQDTTLLNAYETSVLSNGMSPQVVEQDAEVVIGKFEIIKNIMHVHTEEVI